jgi:pyruvate/2-oxoglutarate dehydrogenase complex dihydrolipoamide dehydrogenase (E3) component
VKINGKEIQFMRATISTGGRPIQPQVDGIEGVKYYTSDNIFNLTEQPKQMLVIGGGPVGCELGQGFARLGTDVTMVYRGSQILAREDP